ncbi:Phosphoinositide phospholipase C [Heracleum sosnowskyi]|uniref:Phosphoinositide phospholipase C n=1 Tax=Heracleum sosnowskyi TaxID=360622 RepID=A0AAD8GYM7_9APIA|nr:Phosphoinositide phospholipase C [Heracleum sosnowskyi]
MTFTERFITYKGHMQNFLPAIGGRQRFRVMRATPPPDVVQTFKNYSEDGTHLSPDQLRRFLVEVQGDEGATMIECESIVQQVVDRRHKIDKFSRHSITLDNFQYFLFSTDLNPPMSSQVDQDMTAPLSHYFIYTGHNTYLTGNQINSDCSDVPIIEALKRGVRVIELDLWPDSNSRKGAIHVKHGGTLTRPVDLLKCLRSIKEHAFVTSPYPVVITLEDHLTADLQAEVAQMLTETFGEVLYCPEEDSSKELPSPENLKKRVIISTKPPKEYLENKSADDNKNNLSGRKDFDDGLSDNEPVNDTDDLLNNDKSFDINKQSHSAADFDELDLRMNVGPEYKRITGIHAGKPKGGLKEALKVEADKVRRLSLSEQGLEKAAKSHGVDVVRFTQKNILRIYPKGMRVNSSNYNPLIGWMHGAQMVAFNMQGYGKNLRLMHGMFRANGGCGYVKKPDFLLRAGPGNQVFDPKEKLPAKKTIKVKVYMADGWRLDFKKTHFDSYSPPDFYTKVRIVGVPADETNKKTAVKINTWTPFWNEEFEFPLSVPELAILCIEVCDTDDALKKKDGFGGQNCLPVSQIRPGIRAVPLYDRKGVKYPSVKLLMRFEFV